MKFVANHLQLKVLFRLTLEFTGRVCLIFVTFFKNGTSNLIPVGRACSIIEWAGLVCILNGWLKIDVCLSYLKK